jgi:exoribonuclease R
VPFVSGSGAVSRGGRLGTAPLRRYIDGVAQRQALSVLCNFGGPALTKSECIEAGKIATRAKNKLNNIRSLRNDGRAVRSIDSRQRQALRLLQAQLAGRNRPVPAISSGRHNEVIISGVGAVARCGGIEGTIKPGQRLMVRVKKIDPEKGALSVELVQDGI